MDIDRWRSRLPVKRTSDGELVGWTVDAGPSGSVDTVDGVNPVGHVVAAGLPTDEAEDVLRRHGLASLSAPCWARAPLPMTSGLDLARPSGEWQWRRMLITQLEDTRVWIRPAYPNWAERLVEVTLPLPADDVLLAEPPLQHE